MRRIIAACVLSISLSGCITFPKSTDEFRASSATPYRFTVEHSLRDAYELVAKNTIRCHQGNDSQMAMVGGAFFMFPAASARVEGSINEAAGTAVVSIHYFNPVASGLLQVIDFHSESPASTNVIVYKLNDATKWTTASEAVERWFNGDTFCYQQQ